MSVDFRLRSRYTLTLLPSILIVLLVFFFSLFWVHPALENLMLDQQKAQMRDLVMVAWTVANGLNEEVENGEISLEEAKDRFIDQFSNARYGIDMKDYFWVHDIAGNVIFHPYTTEENILEHTDKLGIPVIQQMNEIALNQGEGFLSYHWQWKDVKVLEKEKVSFIKHFESWNWIIGSGFYKEESLARINTLNKSFLFGLTIFALVIILLIGITIRMKIKTWVQIKKSDKKARKNHERFERMATEISHGIVIIENDELVYCNRRLYEMLDLEFSPTKELPGASEIQFIINSIQACNEGETVDFEQETGKDVRGVWIPTKTGNKKYIVRRRNEDKAHNSIYYILADWSSRKKHIQEINQLSKVVEECPLSIVITKPDGTISYANPYSCISSGYELSELVGGNPRALKSSRVPASTYQELWKTITTGLPWQGELLNQTKSGELYWEHAIISPMFSEEGKIENFYAIKQDITEAKKLEQKLTEAKQKALESDRIKSAFLNNISHEIRTPLNAIAGILPMIEENACDNPESRELKQIVCENVETLVDLVDDILKVSELESSKSFADYDYWNVDELIEDAVQKTIRSKKSELEQIQIRTDFDPNLREKVVYTDISKLETIFEELLTNAIKYTPSGDIKVGYIVKSDQVEFFVSDTGTGISEEEKPHVFKIFHHGNDHFVSLHKGTGLGLNIVKKIIRMMGGSIRFESQLGKGTTFYFSGVCEMEQNQSK